MEISLVKAFGWSLKDIDETDIESLFAFMTRFTESNRETRSPKRKVYADQVTWL